MSSNDPQQREQALSLIRQGKIQIDVSWKPTEDCEIDSELEEVLDKCIVKILKECFRYGVRGMDCTARGITG